MFNKQKEEGEKQKEECPPHLDQLEQQAKNSVEETLLFKLYIQVKGIELNILLADLVAVVKDLSGFLASHGYEGPAVDSFRKTWNRAIERDRFYWEQYYPDVFKPSENAGLPVGLADKVSRGETASIGDALCNPDIEKEWTRYIGWSCLKSYAVLHLETLREIVNGSEWKNTANSEAKMLLLAKKLYEANEDKAMYWLLFILCNAMLLIKTGFAAIPELKK